MIRLRQSGVDEILIKRVRDWYDPGPGCFFSGVTGVASFDPASLFTTGVNGAWYDPSDFTTLFQDAAGTTPVTAVEQPVGRMLDKSGRGNHAVNNSGNSANFPVLSARYNLLTKTEDISAADWTKGGATAASTSSLLETATTGAHSCTLVPTTVAATYIYSVKLKANGRTRFAIAGTASLGGNLGNGIFFDLSTGSYVSGATGTPSITALADGWYQVTYTWAALAGSGPLGVYLADSGTNLSYMGDVTKGMFIKEADLRVANDALNQPAYQRVNTSSDYDTVGFKQGEVFDGINDYLTASAGGGSTTSFFWCSAIRVGKVGAVQTLFSDAGTNTGYRVRINASNQLELSAGNGTSYTTVSTTATLSIGQRAVLTAWHDGTNLNVQINSGTVHQVAFSTATAGTAQFTIGKDNSAASNFFAGWLYEKVYTKDNVPSSAQIADTKAYVANIAGITP